MNNFLMAELHSIRIKKATSLQIEHESYAIIKGRSNPRMWFVPLANSRVTMSGLALFQPLLFSAKLIKFASIVLSSIGLSRLWARNIVNLSTECSLAQFFPSIRNPVYAFFTGTEGPHRKMTVQIMDERGRIAGFAKLSTNPAVEELLHHEAAMLDAVSMLTLQSANIPSLLYIGPNNGATLLVTDTLKTPWSHSITRFTKYHQEFLQELADKTRQASLVVTQIAKELAERLAVLESKLNQEWRLRLHSALEQLTMLGDVDLPGCMSHGDFTPWNTFMAKGKLYVFDWEYAETLAPQPNDLIRFLLNQPRVRNGSPIKKLTYLRNEMRTSSMALAHRAADAAIIIYLLGQVLRQLERIPEETDIIVNWDGMSEQAALLDQLYLDLNVLD